MTSFGKIRVERLDAEKFLNYVSGNDVVNPIGKIIYTQFLTSRGGIEAVYAKLSPPVLVSKIRRESFLV